tara:strand:+ start:350 stop:1444 length:1095 start_codon:yes stop_codon:yes gene_type:complete
MYNLKFYYLLLTKNLRIFLNRNLNIPSTPYKVTLISTYRCNSRCKTCNVWRIYKDDSKKLNEELNNEEILKMINSIKDNLIWLNITGGEPTLRPNFADLVCRIYDSCKNLGFINIPTNGLIPKLEKDIFEKISSHCRKCKIFVTVSLDGMGKENDAIRGINGGSKLVEESFRQLRKLGQQYENLTVLFQATLSKYNLKSFRKTFDFLIENSNNPEVNIAYESKFFHNISNDIDIRAYSEQAIRVLDDIHQKYPYKNLESIFQKIYLKLSKRYLKTKISPLSCCAGYSTITIDPYGNVMPCLFLNCKLGNIRETNYNLKDILKNKKTGRYIKSLKNCKKCWQSCEVYPSIMQHPLRSIIKYITTK